MKTPSPKTSPDICQTIIDEKTGKICANCGKPEDKHRFTDKACLKEPGVPTGKKFTPKDNHKLVDGKGDKISESPNQSQEKQDTGKSPKKSSIGESHDTLPLGKSPDNPGVEVSGVLNSPENSIERKIGSIIFDYSKIYDLYKGEENYLRNLIRDAFKDEASQKSQSGNHSQVSGNHGNADIKIPDNIPPAQTFKDMDDYLNKLREEEKVLTILKKYSLFPSLTKVLIIPYLFGLKSLEVAQKLGVHKSTIEGYYEQFGNMLESEFSSIKHFYIKEEKVQ